MLIIIALLFSITPKLISSRNKRRFYDSINCDRIEVSIPKEGAIIGFIGIIAFVLYLVFYFEKDSDIVLFSPVIILVCVNLIYAPYSWRIVLLKDTGYFIYRGYFGKCENINYSDCKFFYLSANGRLTIKTVNRSIVVDRTSTNKEHLIAFLKKHDVREKLLFQKGL